MGSGGAAPESSSNRRLVPKRPGETSPKASTIRDPRIVAAVALGGALGTPARYGISQAVHISPGTFPWGTFWTNVSGSFLLGFALIVFLERFPSTRYARPFVATGLLASFTTYSTFAVETDLLVKNGHVGVAAAYTGGSVVGGLVAVWLGMRLARALPK